MRPWMLKLNSDHRYFRQSTENHMVDTWNACGTHAAGKLGHLTLFYTCSPANRNSGSSVSKFKIKYQRSILKQNPWFFFSFFSKIFSCCWTQHALNTLVPFTADSFYWQQLVWHKVQSLSFSPSGVSIIESTTPEAKRCCLNRTSKGNSSWPQNVNIVRIFFFFSICILCMAIISAFMRQTFFLLISGLLRAQPCRCALYK